MKVCTDSCLFGAWVTDKMERRCIEAKHILDIGAGTGLLTLMVAQKFSGTIDAIEINENSYLQTKENFIKSPWSERLRIFHGDIKNWNSSVKYDFIICNPPFFENDLISPDQHKNQAKHRASLSLEALLQSIKINLAMHGNFALLLPYHRIQYFKDLAREKDFYLSEELLVKQTPDHSCFRGMLLFETKPSSSFSNELIIKDKDGNYTQSFQFLLRDYYLNLNPKPSKL
jgi:tRNA1Val (adenine37-N6)-methyltransferase